MESMMEIKTLKRIGANLKKKGVEKKEEQEEEIKQMEEGRV